MTDDPIRTGMVISYRFLWSYEHERGTEHGRKARPASVVVPVTAAGNVVAIFPLTTQAPGADRLAIRVPETERRRLKLRGSQPCWILLDEGNQDVMPGSYHVEPISYDPPVHSYGQFSEAFIREMLRMLAQAIRAKRLRMVNRT